MSLKNAVEYLPWGLLASLLFLVVYQIRLKIRGERAAWFHRLLLLFLGLYLTVLFALTVSPVYGFSLSHFAPHCNLIPFAVLAKVAENPVNFWGNIAAFMPLGVLLLLLFNRCQKLVPTLLGGAGLSLLIEALQLFCARGTDVDDVILNTLGTLMGWLVGRWLLGHKPSLRAQIGVLAKKGGAYYGKRHDAQPAAVLGLFVLISVFAVGFANNPPGLNSPTAPVIQDLEQTAKPLTTLLTLAAPIDATNAYLWDTGSNTVLYDKAGDLPIAPASTAKMLNALTVLDYCDEAEEVRVGEEVRRIAEDASRAWLFEGSRLTVRQLLDALLVPSGNDAAYTLAAYTGRQILSDDTASTDEALAAFVAAMNQKAEETGAHNSHFVNPDGYDEEGQYTTAQDLALIAKAFYGSDILREIAGSYRVSDVWLSGQNASYTNTNDLLNPQSPYYREDVLGLKTGNSDQAGCCLVSCAGIKNELYICVVMGSTVEGRWLDTLALYDAIEHK